MARGLLLLTLAALAFAGCTSSLESTLSGNVTLDGNPVKAEGGRSCAVSLHPVGGGPVSTATVDGNGQYAVKTGQGRGLTPGEYVIVVVGTEIPSGASDELEAPLPQPFTPSKYASPETSDLRVTVASGPNSHDIQMNSPATP